MSGVQFDAPLWLIALPLMLLPLRRGLRLGAQRTPWLALLPRDGISLLIDGLLRVAAALAVGATVIVLAVPYREGQVVARVGEGAEIVLAIDRSSSMDEGFRGRGRDGLLRNIQPDPGEETKASVARDVIARFVAAREHDTFSLVLFSYYPIAFLPFTQKTAVVQAAIRASAIGRGLGNTDIGSAMLAAAAQFDGRPYAGSRVIVLVSDGGAQLDPEVKAALAQVLRRHRIGVYWIYLRGAFGQKLELVQQLSAGEIAASPEQSLHDYLGRLGIAYRAYEAVEVASVQAALDDLARHERHALHYTEQLPREELAPAALLTALAALGVLLLSRLFVKRGPSAGPFPSRPAIPSGDRSAYSSSEGLT